MPNPNPDWVYYHALYNVLTQAAAYVATFALLVTVGVVVSTSQAVNNRVYLAVVTVLACVVAVYSLVRWHLFSGIVNEKLGEAAGRTVWLRAGWLASIAAIVTVGLAVWDVVLIMRR